MADLSTTYLGLDLKNPLVASSSPISASVNGVKALEAAGVAAVILPSLFEEQIEIQGYGNSILPSGLQTIPDMQSYNTGANGYLAHLYQAKKAVNIPVIASLNGYYGGGWVQYARVLEAAGADALELNIYYLATKPQVSSSDVEVMYVDLVQQVKTAVKIPVAVKISPYFTAMTHFAMQLDKAGADALVLFNRFYQPDIELETQTIEPSLDLSEPTELRLRLRWVGILRQHVQADLAITGGVHSGKDVVKALLAGAQVAMMTSALLKAGPDYAAQVLNSLENWLDEHEIDSVQTIRGRLSQQAVSNPGAFERANYMRVLQSHPRE